MGRIISLLFLPFLTYGFAKEWARQITHFKFTSSWAYFIAGMAIFAGMLIIGRRQVGFWVTLDHELCHIIAGLFCFKAPTSLTVEEGKGGQVMLTGSNWFVSLSPYFFPTALYFVLLLALLVATPYRPLMVALTGAAVTWHFFSKAYELHLAQTDLHDAGLAFSCLVIPVGNLILIGGGLAYVAEDFTAYWHRALKHIFMLGVWLGTKLEGLFEVYM